MTWKEELRECPKKGYDAIKNIKKYKKELLGEIATKKIISNEIDIESALEEILNI